jgi:hypothetical protein
VVTPGTRYEARLANGTPASGGQLIVNGDAGQSGLGYLVRDVYFEPARGHSTQTVLAEAAKRAAFGRPALIESHRFNYLGDVAADSLAALDELLRMALACLPSLRFMSTESLGDALARQDAHLMEQRAGVRFMVWVRRALVLPRFSKLARLTGLALILRGLGACAGWLSSPASAPSPSMLEGRGKGDS